MSFADDKIWLILATLACIALLFRFRRDDRPALLVTSLIIMAGSVLLVIAPWLRDGFPNVVGMLQETGIVLTGVGLIRLAGMTLFRLLLPTLRINPPRILEDVLVVAGYIGWIISRLHAAGVNPGELFAASAVVTAILAFAMQDTLGNILGGIALQLDDSIDIGDWIKIDDLNGSNGLNGLNGIVIQIGWRSTLLRTRNGEIVVVPNGQLMKNRFQLLGRPVHGQGQWRRWIWFDCPNDVPPAQVIGAVRSAVCSATIANVSASPAPDCLLMGTANGVCQYAARYWLTDLWKDDPTDSEVRQHVIAALRRAGIPLALPQYRLRTVAEGEAFERAKRQRDQARRLEALRNVDLFAALTDEEVELLASRLVYAPYAAGDVITRQGDTAHWLYLVNSGEAEVYVDSGDGVRRLVNSLKAGDFFGEMALLTGAPRRATVVARTNVECFRLDKQSFSELMQARPAMADEIAQELAMRQQTLEETIGADTRGEDPRHALARKRYEMLAAMKRFFSI